MARQRVPEGPQAPPPVQKLRIRYAKRGRLRFASGRDFQRALERALRRAAVPMAYSSGFHPHPRISYADAAPTGVASEAEYVEISVVQRVDPDRLARALDAALPPGLDIVEVVEAGPGPLAARLEASEWRFEFAGCTPEELDEAVRRFLTLRSAEVTRVTKTGPKTFDVRAAVVDMSVLPAQPGPDPDSGGSTLHFGPPSAGERPHPGPCAIMRVVVRHTTPAVRPDDLVNVLRSTTSFAPSAPPLVTRIAQGRVSGEPARVADPLAADRVIIGT